MARILVVEDHEMVASLVKSALEIEGHSVDHAAHGQLAIEALGTTAFDLVITDLRMPVMDGLTLIDTIRETDTELPILVLSADPGLLALVPSGTVSGQRQKPIHPDALVAWVAETLGGKRA